jgi:hypothetical protein
VQIQRDSINIWNFKRHTLSLVPLTIDPSMMYASLIHITVGLPHSGPSQIGTRYNNKPLNKEWFSTFQIISFLIDLINLNLLKKEQGTKDLNSSLVAKCPCSEVPLYDDIDILAFPRIYSMCLRS